MSPQQRGLTADDILDLKPGIGVVQASWQFDILDGALNPLFTVHPLSSDAISVSFDSTATSKRTLSNFHLTATEQGLIDSIRHRVRPRYVVRVNGQDTHYPLGVFLFSDTNRSRYSYGLELKGTLTDQTVILDQGRESSFSLKVGASVLLAILQIIAEVNIPASTIVFDPSSAVVATPQAWPAGTSRYQIMSDLCALGNYYPPYFDNRGYLRLRTSPASLLNLRPDHFYQAQDSRMHQGTLVESDDLVKAPNRYLVVDTSAGNAPIVGIYDLPDSAPQSYANRGYRVTTKIDGQGLKDTAAANALAQATANTDHNNFNLVQFDSTPDPRHDGFDIVEYLGVNYREVKWSLKASPGGPHTHNLSKIYGQEA